MVLQLGSYAYIRCTNLDPNIDIVCPSDETLSDVYAMGSRISHTGGKCIRVVDSTF